MVQMLQSQEMKCHLSLGKWQCKGNQCETEALQCSNATLNELFNQSHHYLFLTGG